MPGPASAIWRPMTVGDLSAVEAIAAEVHPNYPEEAAVPAERLRLSPQGCLVLAQDAGVTGYVISHPWHALAPPKLDTLLGAIPSPAGTWYIHDLALLPAARGHGHADAVVEHLAAIAVRTGLPEMSLTAVSGSGPFWARHGFVRSADASVAAALASYGGDATFMVRKLG